MPNKIKKLHEFTNRNDWLDYALTNMPNVKAEQYDEDGLEIHLGRKEAIIGKWYEERQYGYIEEYRSDERLSEEIEKEQEQEQEQDLS